MLKERIGYMEEDFYTLTSYIHNKRLITYAMEDYLEMIYRETNQNLNINVTILSKLLHVKKSSVSKMLSKLKTLELLENNNQIKLTKTGFKIARYLYIRHNILETFLKYLNKQDFKLEQVEKIEHFIDNITLNNLAKLNKDLII